MRGPIHRILEEVVAVGVYARDAQRLRDAFDLSEAEYLAELAAYRTQPSEIGNWTR